MRRVAVALALLAVVGCGIPLDARPEPFDLDPAAVPDDAGPLLGELAAVSIYLIRDDLLVHVTRDLPAPPSPETILDSMLDDVTEPEERGGLRTAIPPGTTLLSVVRDGSVLTVDLNQEFTTVGGEEEIQAVAQIVLSLTSIEGVDLVEFQLEGVPTDVPVASGALSVDPVGSDDYASLVTPVEQESAP